MRCYNEHYRSINRYICSIQINKTRYRGSEEIRLMKEYTDKQINSMILFLRVNNIAEMYYLENDQDPDRKFYCYRSDSWLTRKQVISTALDSGWKEGK